MQIGSTGPAGLPVALTRADATREIARTREAFLASGELTGSLPRPLIAERWQRCRQLGIDPLMDRAPTVLGSDEISAIMAREDLGRAGRSVLEEFGRVVEGTGHVIVLADDAGRILHAAGHSGVQDALERVNLAPGGLWSEAAVGPNGIGTPLALGAPEVVFGPEHYCRGWQSFFCCGAPVRDPGSGRVLGAVDITGPAGKAHPMAVALALSIVRWVEGNLTVLGLERRNALLRSFRTLERRWPNEPALVVDAAGKIVDLNAAAAGALGLSSVARVDELAPLLPELASQMETRGGREAILVFRGADAAPRSLPCRVEPVTIDGRVLGSAVVVCLRSAAPSARASTAHAGDARGGVAARPKYGFADLLGESSALREALRLARAVALGSQHKPVLILGESGTGKEIIAQAIHAESSRAHRPFVGVNCGALPRELVESELFGYASGAFTGARREGQAGRFEVAQGGTIFLDEVDSMPIEAQAKLLRVIETGEVVRLGSSSPIALNVAIMAATGPDARQRVEEGSFRLDLFHRLSVVEIVMPPLRERPGDIPLLAASFLERECRLLGRGPLVLLRETTELLTAYPWPGNIRELQNLCARWAITVGGGEVRPDDLPAHVRPAADAKREADRQDSLRRREDAIIRQTLLETGGRVAEAARRLAVNKTTIYRWMKRSDGRSCSMQ